MTQFYQVFYRERFLEGGGLHPLEVPENFNYGYDVLDALAEELPQRRALLWRSDEGEGVELTFEALRAKSNQAARALGRAGLCKGDVLTTVLRSRWEYWVIALAAHKLGLILSPVYHRLTPPELSYRMEKAGAKAVVCVADGEIPAHVRQGAAAAGVPLRFTVGGKAPGFQDFSALARTEPDTLERVPTRQEEPVLLYFTSGTTGHPKAVLHDHAYTLAAYWGARYMQDIHDGSLHFATGDTGWEVVSGTKFYGQWLCRGALLVYDYRRFPPEAVLQTLAECRATSIMAQPTVYRKFTDVGMDKFDLSAVTCLAVGGEKLLPALAKTVEEQMGQPLYEGYAQSEAGLIAANSKALGRKEGSVGRILPKYHVELLRGDGTFAPPGEVGEVVIVADGGKRPMGLLMGYYHDEEAARQLWDGNLFHTGDLAEKDGEDFLYYKGRMDGIIKTKGYRVSPVEIEEALSRHPAVEECLAVGEPDGALGQRIKVYVKLRAGYAPAKALARTLTDFHNSTCTGYKKIRALEFVPALAHNANGKLLRDQFRDRL